jgi:hypothetical protein
MNAPHALSNAQILSLAPSVGAAQAHNRVSDRYSFVPTIDVVNGLRESGWFPVSAKQQTVRDQSRAGFQKHVIRFQRATDLETYASQEVFQYQPGQHKIVKGEVRPEIVLLNSHDRSSAYQLHAGLFRLVCSNGLVIADATLERISITHIDFDPAQVIGASLDIAQRAPMLMDRVNDMRARQLSPIEARAFAEGALLLKYEDLEKSPVSPEKVLEARRLADSGTDLFSTLNRVQENLIKGGQKEYRRNVRNDEGKLKRAPRTRAVNGIDGDVKLNKALWHMAEVLKAGGNPVEAL